MSTTALRLPLHSASADAHRPRLPVLPAEPVLGCADAHNDSRNDGGPLRGAGSAPRLVRPPGAWVQRGEPIMGCAVRVELWCEQRSGGVAAAAAVLDEMHRIDRAMSPLHPGSELCRINREAAAHAVELTPEMSALIGQALDWSRRSDGAFDISFAAVGQHYDHRRRLRPDAAMLARAQALVGWRQLEHDAGAHTLRFARDGMRIDLGGCAKGHAVDRCIALLRERGIAHAMVSAGSDCRAIGERREGTRVHPWQVVLRDPRESDARLGVLPLHDAAVSTASDATRAFDDLDGREVGLGRVHAVIDPASGLSPQHLRSVTVLAREGLAADALSKAVFVLGAARGLALLAQHGAEGVLLDATGALHLSPGLQRSSAAAAI